MSFEISELKDIGTEIAEPPTNTFVDYVTHRQTSSPQLETDFSDFPPASVLLAQIRETDNSSKPIENEASENLPLSVETQADLPPTGNNLFYYPNGALKRADIVTDDYKYRQDFDIDGNTTKVIMIDQNGTETLNYRPDGVLDSRMVEFEGTTTLQRYDDSGKIQSEEMISPTSRRRTQFDKDGSVTHMEHINSHFYQSTINLPDGTRISNQTRADGSTSVDQSGPAGEVYSRTYDPTSQAIESNQSLSDGSSRYVRVDPEMQTETDTEADGTYRTRTFFNDRGIVFDEEGSLEEGVTTTTIEYPI